jgi:hypothetical protein
MDPPDGAKRAEVGASYSGVARQRAEKRGERRRLE